MITPTQGLAQFTTNMYVESNKIAPNEYWIETKQLITIIEVGVEFDGLTSYFLDGTQSLMGDLFIIVDGIPDRVTAIEDGNIYLALTNGYHSISLLYMGKDNNGFVYSSSTIQLDLSAQYKEPEFTKYDFKYILNDNIVVGEMIDQVLNKNSVRNIDLPGGIDANISMVDREIGGIFDFNSYGSDTLQVAEQFPATKGQVFFTDDLGIYRDPNELYFRDEIKIGVLVIHEAGVTISEDYDGIMLKNATGAFDYYIEYQSFTYKEPTVNITNPSSKTTEVVNSPDKNENSPIIASISKRQVAGNSNEEKSPIYLLPTILTLMIIRRKRR